MIQDIETRWRYVLAAVGGLLAGSYIGSMLATIYVILARREDIATIDPLEPFFMRYSWATLEAYPDILQVALLITGSVTIALTTIGVAETNFPFFF